MERRGNRHSASFTRRDPGILIPLWSGPFMNSNISPIPTGDRASPIPSRRNPTGFFSEKYPPFLLEFSGHPLGLPALCWPKAGTAGTAS